MAPGPLIFRIAELPAPSSKQEKARSHASQPPKVILRSPQPSQPPAPPIDSKNGGLHHISSRVLCNRHEMKRLLIPEIDSECLRWGLMAAGGGRVDEIRETPHDKRWGLLRNANPSGDFSKAARYGKTRRETRCHCPAMSNGRCRLHGGLSTGPKTAEGIERIQMAVTKHGR